MGRRPAGRADRGDAADLLRGTTPAAVEEERRLLYVGVTRAREHLHLSWATARSPGGRASRQPSRFLDGLRPAASARALEQGRSTSRAGGARRGRRPRCRRSAPAAAGRADRRRGPHPRPLRRLPPAYDEAVFERLRAWRLAAAQQRQVPAYVVFTDATLEAVAERGPVSLAELATINGVGRSSWSGTAATCWRCSSRVTSSCSATSPALVAAHQPPTRRKCSCAPRRGALLISHARATDVRGRTHVRTETETRR